MTCYLTTIKDSSLNIIGHQDSSMQGKLFGRYGITTAQAVVSEKFPKPVFFLIFMPKSNEEPLNFSETCCWWLKSCTTRDVWNPVNNGINYLSTGAGFQPSTVWSASHLPCYGTYRLKTRLFRLDSICLVNQHFFYMGSHLEKPLEVGNRVCSF